MDSDALFKMFEMHIKECDGRDNRNVSATNEIKNMIKGLWDAHDDMRRTVTSLQIKLAVGIGMFVAAGKILDYFFLVHGK